MQWYGLQEQGAAAGPAPVTAEELEAIMKGGGQQPKPRRKKQKTDSAIASNPQAPVSGGQPGSTAAAAAAAAAVPAAPHHQQLSAIDGGQLAAAAARAGQFTMPPDRDSSSAALAKAPAQLNSHQTPDLPSAAAMPPPRVSTSAGLSGQGVPSQPLGQGQPAVAPAAWGHPYPPAAGGSTQPVGQPIRSNAVPAESQGGSVASDSAWGTEEAQTQRKLQRQAEKQRMK